MEVQVIQSKIYEFRGCKVMLDRDLAEMYNVETRALNQATKRNPERFPSEFMFQLSTEEFENWKSQIVMSNEIKMGLRRPPFAFTEQGVAMLSAVLKSEVAIKISIQIMNAFVAMRQLVLSPPIIDAKQLKQEMKELKQYIEEVFTDYNDINDDTRMQLELINKTLAELHKNKELNKPHRPIGYQHYKE